MRHNLKIRKEYADAKLEGNKPFEIRYNGDRDFQSGETVTYTVIGGILDEPIAHGLDGKVYEITYVTDYMQRDGYVVFGEREIK